MTRRDEIETRLTAVRERISRACAEAERDPGEVTLIVVTKFHPVSDVAHLVDLGVTDIGENRDQEAGAKIAALDPATRAALTVHFIGQLQTNKARHVVQYADIVQSVDRPKLVGALDRAVAARVEALSSAEDQSGRTVMDGATGQALGADPRRSLPGGGAVTPLDVLLQVDLGEGEDAGRGGILPSNLTDLAERVSQTQHLQLRGLMAVAPFGLDEAGTAAAFERLAALAAEVRRAHPGAILLSAGMSGDLELAIRCGATHLRVGTAILGTRPDPR